MPKFERKHLQTPLKTKIKATQQDTYAELRIWCMQLYHCIRPLLAGQQDDSVVCKSIIVHDEVFLATYQVKW